MRTDARAAQRSRGARGNAAAPYPGVLCGCAPPLVEEGALFVLCCAFLAYQVSIRMKPMYETTKITVEVDDQQPNGVIGKDAEEAHFRPMIRMSSSARR